MLFEHERNYGSGMDVLSIEDSRRQVEHGVFMAWAWMLGISHAGKMHRSFTKTSRVFSLSGQVECGVLRLSGRIDCGAGTTLAQARAPHGKLQRLAGNPNVCLAKQNKHFTFHLLDT